MAFVERTVATNRLVQKFGEKRFNSRRTRGMLETLIAPTIALRNDERSRYEYETERIAIDPQRRDDRRRSAAVSGGERLGRRENAKCGQKPRENSIFHAGERSGPRGRGVDGFREKDFLLRRTSEVRKDQTGLSDSRGACEGQGRPCVSRKVVFVM